jgi:hypothetical protein
MRPIPLSVKSEIVRKYLEGDSITEISKLCNVSVGAVSAITNEVSKKDEYLIVIREVTKVFKEHNLEISEVILGIRLKNKVKKVELTIPFFEDFLEFTNTESFRLGMDHEKFLEVVKRILHFEKIFKKKIEDIPASNTYAVKEFVRLTNEISKAKDEISKAKEELEQLYVAYDVKKSELEQYLREKPLFTLSKIAREVALPTHYDWMVISDRRFKKASKKAKIKIEPIPLYKKLNAIYKEPDKHIEIVKQIMDLQMTDKNYNKYYNQNYNNLLDNN